MAIPHPPLVGESAWEKPAEVGAAEEVWEDSSIAL
jgi:hypothetical protein